MVPIKSQFPLDQLNTLQLKSVADSYIEIKTEEDLKQLWQTSERPLNWFILGGGSNLVLSERIPGLVVHIGNKGRALLIDEPSAWTVEACAGENWHEFVQWTLSQNIHGLENLSLIPGTVGAAPIQNIGAYGVEVKDVIESVTCFDLRTGAFCELSNSACQFAYRDSYFKQQGAGRFVVWKVRFKFSKGRPLQLSYGDVRREVEAQNQNPTAIDVAQAVIRIRESKLPNPNIIGNAGSFFKNPIVSESQFADLKKQHPGIVGHPYLQNQFKLAAGWLIENSGWKGRRLGPVGMYEKQALVLVNHGGATASDVWKLAQAVCQDVLKKFNVTIEPEPIRW